MSDSRYRRTVVAAADRIDPDLGAFVSVDVDAALAAAAEVSDGPLAGVPVAVKDLVDVAGTRTTYGSARFADHVADRTAPAVDALRALGAVVLGKTNLNEFAYGVSGHNPHHGPVRTPADTRRTAGGSSGGSAAAVASGAVPLAVGTDTSGSVRIPAACCGVWGFKCAPGASLAGVFPLAPSYDSIGYLAVDPDLLARVLRLTELPDPATVRVGVIGVDVEVPALPAEHWTVFRHEAWQVHGAAFTADPDSYGRDLQRKLRQPRPDDAELAAARGVERAWRRAYADATAGFDVLVDRVLDGAAPLLDAVLADYAHDTSYVHDRLLRHTPAANALGWAALAFPTADGPRQVLAPPGREAALLAVARDLSGRD